MQEDVTRQTIATGKKTLVLALTAVELTAELLALLMRKVMGVEKAGETAQNPDATNVRRGKQPLKDLMARGEEVNTAEIADRNVGMFKSIARDYGVDYSIRKDKSVEPPVWTVFFSAKDADVITAAFREYTNKVLGKETNRDDLEAEAEIEEAFLEAEVRITEGRVPAAERELAAAEKELADAQSDVRKNESRFGEARDLVSEAENRFAEVTGGKEEAEREVAEARSELANAEPENIEAAGQRLAEAEQSLSDANGRVTDAESILEKSRSHEAEAEKDLTVSRERVPAAQSTVAEKRAGLEDAGKSADDAKQQLAEFREGHPATGRGKTVRKEKEKEKDNKGLMDKLDDMKAKSKELAEKGGKERNLKRSDREI
jgi:hypothetical protein